MIRLTLILLLTLAYLFGANTLPSTALNPNTKKQINSTSEEEELRLMVQVFLYKNDLQSALQVAQIGYDQYPNSYYWNEKMATICQWTDRPARAMKHLQKMYALKHDPKLENKLIEYGKTTFQYESIEPFVLKKVRRNPSEENIDLLITIYKQIGFPEKAITVLDQEYKRTHNHLLISKALDLTLETGDLDLAEKYISILEAQDSLSKQDAVLIARYYYVLRDIKNATLTLDKAQRGDLFEAKNCSSEVEYLTKEYFSKECISEIKYFQLKSDLNWYLQKNLIAANASQILITSDVARLSDYERVAVVYQDIDSNIATNAVRKGYIKYKKSYMFFSYANDAINKKRFEELQKLLETVDEETSPLAQQAMYWLIKSKVYNHYKQFNLEAMALKKALSLSPNDMEVKTALLWYFMDTGDMKNTKLILLEIEENEVPQPLYLSMASGYFYTHNIDRASYYLDALEYNHDLETQTIEYKFLQAYIYQIQTRDELFQTKINEIFTILNQQREQIPSLKKDNEHLTNYFNAAMYVLHANDFEQKLHEAKPYLKKKNYDEIRYSWALQNNAFENSHAIYSQAKQPELWMQFSNAIVLQHHTNIENMLERYLLELSQGDASYQAKEDGQTALAQTINYGILNQNNYNQNSYIEQIELSKLRSDKLDLKLSRYVRDPLLQNYVKLENESYIGDDWYILTGFGYYKNSSSDQNVLINVPKNTYDLSLGVKKLTNRASIEMSLIYNHYMQNYLSLLLDLDYQISTDFHAGLEIAKNINSDESTQLYLGGKKDLIKPKLTYQWLNSTSIEVGYELSKFYSQDNVNLGKGRYFNASINKQLRNGYPDMRVGVFFDNGVYSESSATHGIIDTLQTEPYKVLPNNFYNIGFNFSFGEINKNLYTRVWRPYFEVFPYYNSDINDYTYGLNAGIGGKVFHQDHMSIGVSYSDSVNGIGGKIFEFYIDYQFMYTLSKEI
jgi:polysaccharide biosynthesis protein PelB